MAILARYDGVDGESTDANHDKWIDVLSFDWGAEQPGSSSNGQSRRRGSPEIEDLVLAFEYDKASPKLLEACLKGRVFAKLEVELTTNTAGARSTYLRYELKNVLVTSYQVSAVGDDDDSPPVVVVGNNFEEIKVTYTEFDGSGASQGNVETSYRVETGGSVRTPNTPR